MGLKPFLFSALLISSYAFAAETQKIETSVSKPATQSTPNVLLGWRSYDDTTRFETLNNGSSNRQTFNGKQEVFAGYRMNNGWGGFVQFAQYRQEYSDPSMNKWAIGDTSLSLVHPDLYNGMNLSVSGLFRAYVPTTDRSKNQNIRQYAYYSTQFYALGKGRGVFNQAIPRYFAADVYHDSDTVSYLEDRTIYTQKVNSWFGWGIGNWMQIENHKVTATGYCDEVIPQLDFTMSKNILVGPRLSLPVLSRNSVYDGPTNATLNQARAELFFQAVL